MNDVKNSGFQYKCHGFKENSVFCRLKRFIIHVVKRNFCAFTHLSSLFFFREGERLLNKGRGVVETIFKISILKIKKYEDLKGLGSFELPKPKSRKKEKDRDGKVRTN